MFLNSELDGLEYLCIDIVDKYAFKSVIFIIFQLNSYEFREKYRVCAHAHWIWNDENENEMK